MGLGELVPNTDNLATAFAMSNTLANAVAVSNKLAFILDPGCLFVPPASMKL